jgi:hypothetical protein
MDKSNNVEQFINDPTGFFEESGYAAQHIPADELRDLQLGGLKLRFEALRDKVAVLKAVADKAEIEKIDHLDDAASLLFPHTVYKSYPISLLEKSRFDQLTKWLGRLTTVDVSKVDVSHCESIDDWLEALELQTDLRVLNSSGTTGAMSFLPRTAKESERHFRTIRMSLADAVDPEGKRNSSDDYYHVVYLGYSEGRGGMQRVQKGFAKYMAGSAERYHSLYTGRMSSDVMFLAARMRAAAARGETLTLNISPALKARRAEFEEGQKNVGVALSKLFDELIVNLQDERVFLFGTSSHVYDIAREGLSRGLRNVFAPGSIVHTGGGAKGVVLPPDWEKQVEEFAGVPRLINSYGMSELMSHNYLCDFDRYHFQPWLIPYILEPDDGTPLPREGVQTGRAAFFDLAASAYWGGFVSGDEVTIDWTQCKCGRTTPHIAKTIQRYSEKKGGDDKISCAAADEAHSSAADFLISAMN